MKPKTNATPRPLRLAVLVLALIVGAAAAQPGATALTDPAFDAAMQAYERNHWQVAYTGFAALADRGDTASGRIALQMWRHGPALYGTSFTAQPQQVRHWTHLWDCDRTPAAQACVHAQRAP